MAGAAIGADGAIAFPTTTGAGSAFGVTVVRGERGERMMRDPGGVCSRTAGVTGAAWCVARVGSCAARGEEFGGVAVVSPARGGTVSLVPLPRTVEVEWPAEALPEVKPWAPSRGGGVAPPAT